MADLLTLCQLVQRGSRDPNISAGALAGLGARLAESFPPPLRPLARATLVAGARDEITPLPKLLMVLAGAFARGQAVRLSLALPAANGLPDEPIVQPEVLLPYGGSWYLIGHGQHPDRDLIVCLDEIASVAISS